MKTSFVTEIKKIKVKLQSEKSHLGNASEILQEHITSFEKNSNLFRLIIRFNRELIKLQNRKISSYSAIEPIINFLEFCLPIYKDDFLLTVTQLTDSFKKSIKEDQRIKNHKNFMYLFGRGNSIKRS